ncbi:MAG: riboflavin synthase [Lentisphaeria bacterium]|nr:riboflavin synthase [Lentisphaeria bacterium]NQZ70427.1 riboflavin synthase [Lentisphaeria bacterium]
MFTGLIEKKVQVAEIESLSENKRMCLDAPGFDLAIGDSLAVNGVCLTVDSIENDRPNFHILEETLSKTNLGTLSEGDFVNIEQPLKLNDRLDGHIVSGHVDCVSELLKLESLASDHRLTFKLESENAMLVIPMGSIAVNGVSLTIAELNTTSFTVCLIPHSWEITNLSELTTGSKANIEFDMMGKYILRNQELTV